MTYNEILKVTKNDMIFYNGDFKCKAKDLDVLNRNDFYYII